MTIGPATAPLPAGFPTEQVPMMERMHAKTTVMSSVFTLGFSILLAWRIRKPARPAIVAAFGGERAPRRAGSAP